MEGSRTAGRKRRRFRFWVAASDKNQDRCAISETGTGFADAKLSEILPSARVARFVRMTQKAGGGCLSSIRHAAILGLLEPKAVSDRENHYDSQALVRPQSTLDSSAYFRPVFQLRGSGG